MAANLIAIKSPWEGAAARLTTLRDAEHEANKARIAAYETIRAPYDAACEAAFEAHGAGPESAAAYAALREAMNGVDVHPDYAPFAAAHEAARAAVPAAALSYAVATTLLPTLLRIHNGGGWPAGEAPAAPDMGADIEAILWALPEGPLPGFQGWRKVTVSPHGAWERPREVRLCYGKRTVASADNRGRTSITVGDEETRRLADEKARNRAEHDAYQARLALVRGALDADPALRAAVEAVWASCHGATVHLYGPAVEAAGHSQGFPAVPVEEPGRSGALALAYLGWGWAPGQAGGVLLVPGVGQVGVRGALRLPQEAGMISSDAAD